MRLFICFAIWSIVACLMIWRSYQTTKKAVNYVQRLHKIPCSNCLYFTGDYRLKCTVHPIMALSEEAIDCRDFELCSTQSDRNLKKSRDKNKPIYNKTNFSYLNSANKSINKTFIKSN